MISVIIPTYNRSRMTREAIESTLAQTFDDFELIVVDDGSIDDTATMVRGFGDRLIYARQENRGVSAARNRGLELARGAFIALLDSDDLWLADKLKTQVDFFRANPDAVICQTEETWVRDGRRINPKKYHRKQSGDIFAISLERCMVSPSAVMWRRELLDEVGVFDTSLPACEDYDLWLRVSCRYPVHLIPTPLIVKRGGHGDQLSATVPTLDRYRIESIIKLLKDDILTEDYRNLALRTLERKARVYLQGLRKRNRKNEINRMEELLRRHEIVYNDL